MYYHYLSPAAINLQRELTSGYHPQLLKLIGRIESWEERLEEIAAWCGVKIEGEYTAEQLDVVFDAIATQLLNHREYAPALKV